ncbi:ABC transporter ATP-binding protein [Pacificimonas sp. ICDLI1SI03]
MTMLQADRLCYRAGDLPLVEDASFSLPSGGLTMLIGPNGSGKSTLLRLTMGLLRADSGHARLQGNDVSRLTPAERARRVAYLPQDRSLAWPQPVQDIVALGRFAHGGAPGRLTGADRGAVASAISDCGLTGFERRAVDTLSGGELARVHMARAIAAQTPLLIADEPIAALDPRYQHEVMQLFARLSGAGRTVLAVVHDLNLAALYADRLIWMRDGRIVADGPPMQTLTEERLREVFRVEGTVRTAGKTVQVDISGISS